MKKLIQELKQLVLDIELEKFPYVVDNIIYVGKYYIATNDNMYHIYYTDTNRCIGKTFTKHGALALIFNVKAKRRLDRVYEYDRKLYFNNNDIPFFKEVISKTKDDLYRSTIEIRLEEAVYNVRYTKRRLQSIINFNFD